MKLNIANPATGLQRTVEIEEEKRLLQFYEKRIGSEVSGDSIGDEFRGCVFRISGGNDKQGFPMLQGVLTNGRVRLLFRKGMKCYRPRRAGEKKRKSVRGCIVGPDLAVLNLVLIRRGEAEIPGLTDGSRPRRLGPKRASKIRRLFNLNKDDNVCKYVVRRTILRGDAASGNATTGEENTSTKQRKSGGAGSAVPGIPPRTKAPRIQRLITPRRLQRKRRRKSLKKQRRDAAKLALKEYLTMIEGRKQIVASKKFPKNIKKSSKIMKKPASTHTVKSVSPTSGIASSAITFSSKNITGSKTKVSRDTKKRETKQ